MRRDEKERLIKRLQERYAGFEPALDVGNHDLIQHILRGMVDAGASRFGVRVGHSHPGAVRSCELAPPLARMIDHTALKPDTTETQIKKLCDEALRYCFASVCVNPSYVPLASGLLRGSPVAVCTVLGFPLGATKTEAKALEAGCAVRDGADELDMVLNVGFLKSGLFDAVEADIAAVVRAGTEAAASLGKRIVVKVILETALLTDEEKVIACVLTRNGGADFVKTSTGFSTGGATAADVALMRRVVGDQLGIKASGGVRSRKDAEAMIAKGATRIGASASVEIIRGLNGGKGY